MVQLNVGVEFRPDVIARETAREILVKQIFGLPPGAHSRVLLASQALKIGNLTYLTGYSGTGKSSLLNAIRFQLEVPDVKEPEDCFGKSVIESFQGDLAEAVQWLGRFGLGEARVLTTRVKHLSVGQRERFRLAFLLWQKPSVLILDEFLSSLDRVTARIIAFQFQRVVRNLNLTCIVATAHDDLKDALHPDTLVELDFEGGCEITYPETKIRSLPESQEVLVSEGTMEDYFKLKPFHYMDQHDPTDVVSVRKAEFRGKLVGVRVFTKLFPSAYEKVGLFRKINESAALSSRVVVHPVFRGLGISSRLDLAEADRLRFKKIFTHSALALYFPFDHSGGYRVLEHVSVPKTSDHSEYEKLLVELGLPSPTLLNDPKICEEFWKGLSQSQQGQVINLAIRILSSYDERHTRYLCEHLGISLPVSAEADLLRFFSSLLRRTPSETFWKLLSEALHFPMLGMVKDL